MIKEARCNQSKQMLRDYLQGPHRFYADCYDAAKEKGISRPGKELADILSIAESSANRYARERESDESPTATGARSDLERMILTIKHFAIPHSLESAQTLINALQQLVDDEVERWASESVSANPEFLRERAMRESADVCIAIGASKHSADVLREEAESDIATKKYLAVKRLQEQVKKRA